jgi:hypothetical protein
VLPALKGGICPFVGAGLSGCCVVLVGGAPYEGTAGAFTFALALPYVVPAGTVGGSDPGTGVRGAPGIVPGVDSGVVPGVYAALKGGVCPFVGAGLSGCCVVLVGGAPYEGTAGAFTFELALPYVVPVGTVGGSDPGTDVRGAPGFDPGIVQGVDARLKGGICPFGESGLSAMLVGGAPYEGSAGAFTFGLALPYVVPAGTVGGGGVGETAVLP